MIVPFKQAFCAAVHGEREMCEGEGREDEREGGREWGGGGR